MQVRALLHAGTMVLALMVIPSLVAAHGSDGGGFPSRGGPRETVPEPEDDTSVESSTWFGDHNNEQPEQVDHYLERVEAQRHALSRAGAGPMEVALLDVKVRRLQIRKQIATKRQERDALRRKGPGPQLQRVEREIHALKARFKAAAANAAPVTEAASQHEEHGH